jgi:hypothetical protein
MQGRKTAAPGQRRTAVARRSCQHKRPPARLELVQGASEVLRARGGKPACRRGVLSWACGGARPAPNCDGARVRQLCSLARDGLIELYYFVATWAAKTEIFISSRPECLLRPGLWSWLLGV